MGFLLNVSRVGDDGEYRIARPVDSVSMEGAETIPHLDRKTPRALFVEMIGALLDSTQETIVATQLQDTPATLTTLGIHFGISKKRVRQLRERGFEGLKTTTGQRDLELEHFV